MEKRHRVLIVSGRLLVAQSLWSLMENTPGITGIDMADNLHDALRICRREPPDALVIDLPSGADTFVDRPVRVNGREIKTIILQEEEKDGKTRLYVHSPGKKADLKNLMAAIFSDDDARQGKADLQPGALRDIPPAVPTPSQPTNLMRANASGPSKARISPSKPEV